jgi:hypothetical protein
MSTFEDLALEHVGSQNQIINREASTIFAYFPVFAITQSLVSGYSACGSR